MEKLRHQFEIRQAVDDDGKPLTKFEGYAVKWDDIAHGEVFRTGAFAKTLQENPDIKAYWMHNRQEPLGRTKNGSLNVSEDDTGLSVEIFPNLDTQVGRDAMAYVARGDVDQMSFAFLPIKETVTEHNDSPTGELREVLEAQLFEVSPEIEPWYQNTSLEARDKNEATTDEPEQPEPGLATHSTDEGEADNNDKNRNCMKLKLIERRLNLQAKALE